MKEQIKISIELYNLILISKILAMILLPVLFNKVKIEEANHDFLRYKDSNDDMLV